MGDEKERETQIPRKRAALAKRRRDDRGSSQSSVRQSCLVRAFRLFKEILNIRRETGSGKSEESRGRAVHDLPDDQVDEIQSSDLRRQ